MGLTYALGDSAAVPRCFAPRVRPGMCVYDLGANKGQMTLLFAALVGPTGRIVSLEPAPAEFAHLTNNVKINSLSNVETIQAAAADREGELTFTYAAGRPTQGKLRDVERTYVIPDADTFTVRALTIDSLVNDRRRPDVIKIDVEGAAASVLRGAARLLSQSSPVIYLELHGPDEQAGVRDELLTRGYVAETLDGARVLDPTDGWHTPLWCYRPRAHASGA
jgi:FkbM family methyltransferase